MHVLLNPARHALPTGRVRSGPALTTLPAALSRPGRDRDIRPRATGTQEGDLLIRSPSPSSSAPSPPPSKAGQRPPPRPRKKKVELDDREGDPFKELGLSWDLREQAGGVRVRQHVNPLTRELARAHPPLEWAEVFEDPTLPLTVDIGCGYGRFLMLYAKREREAGIKRNYIGLEVRKPIVERGNTWAGLLGLQRSVHFVQANGTLSFESMLKTYPGLVDLVCVQYPDPNWKKKYMKRRIVQPTLVSQIAALLKPGARVFLQSDVKPVSEDMRDSFEKFGAAEFMLDPELHAEGKVFYSAAGEDMAGASALEGTEGPEGSMGSADSESMDSEGPGVESGSDDLSGSTGPESGTPLDASIGQGTGMATRYATADDGFESTWQHQGWLLENPLGTPTEREVYTLRTGAFGGKAFRVLLRRR